jgi:hypothetical protein
LKLILLAKGKIPELSKDSNIFKLFAVSNQLGMSKLRSVVCLKVRELSQESGDLSNDSEKIIRSRMIMHLKSLYCLVVLDDRVKRPFFQLLPVPAKIIFGVWIEKKQEVFNVGYNLL